MHIYSTVGVDSCLSICMSITFQGVAKTIALWTTFKTLACESSLHITAK